VPSAYVPLTEVPLTPTGKIDRLALPAPDWQAPGTGAAPSTAIERQLAGIWAEVLGLTDIGVDDNFFDIGGRSRLAAQVFGRIETDLGVRLPLATLFEYPTIRGLARAIERSARTPSVWRCLVPIRARGSRLPLFFIHPVGGNVLAYRELVRRLGQNIPCYGLQSVGLDGVTPPLTSVEAMAARYLDEVRSVQREGPYRLCGFSFGGLVAFEMARTLREQSDDVGLLALLDTDYPEYPSGRSFARLAQSPFFRARIYPVLQRARRHARTLGRLGLGGYVRATAARGTAAGEEADFNPFWVVAERVRSANMRAAINYVPRQYDRRITYFRALHAGRSVTQDKRTLWRRLARDVDLIDVPGGHSDLRLEPLVGIVAREILQCLSRDPYATRIA
jgi:thioesterase domain-containing protein